MAKQKTISLASQATSVITAIPLNDAFETFRTEYALEGKQALRTTCAVALTYFIGIHVADPSLRKKEADIRDQLRTDVDAILMARAQDKMRHRNAKVTPEQLAKAKVGASTGRLYLTLGTDLYHYLVDTKKVAMGAFVPDMAAAKTASDALAVLVNWMSNQTFQDGNYMLNGVHSLDEIRVYCGNKAARPTGTRTTSAATPAPQRAQKAIETAAKAVTDGTAKSTDVAHGIALAYPIDHMPDLALQAIERLALMAKQSPKAMEAFDKLTQTIVKLRDEALEHGKALVAAQKGAEQVPARRRVAAPGVQPN